MRAADGIAMDANSTGCSTTRSRRESDFDVTHYGGRAINHVLKWTGYGGFGHHQLWCPRRRIERYKLHTAGSANQLRSEVHAWRIYREFDRYRTGPNPFPPQRQNC